MPMRSKLSLILVPAMALSLGLLTAEAQEPAAKAKPIPTTLKANFDKDTVDALPAGWESMDAGGKDAGAVWKVLKEEGAVSSPNVVGVAQNKNRGEAFSLLLNKDLRLKDVQLEAQIRAFTGKEEQGGGLAWRAKDARNYYVARWNPQKEDFAVFVAKGGKLTLLAGLTVSADTRKWHKIEVIQKGSHILAQFDGGSRVMVDDNSLSDAGAVGFWVKSDATAEFDSLAAKEPVRVGGVKVDIDQVPPEVSETLKRESAGGKIEEITEYVEAGHGAYHAIIIKGEQKLELDVRDDGKIEHKEPAK